MSSTTATTHTTTTSSRALNEKQQRIGRQQRTEALPSQSNDTASRLASLRRSVLSLMLQYGCKMTRLGRHEDKKGKIDALQLTLQKHYQRSLTKHLGFSLDGTTAAKDCGGNTSTSVLPTTPQTSSTTSSSRSSSNDSSALPVLALSVQQQQQHNNDSRRPSSYLIAVSTTDGYVRLWRCNCHHDSPPTSVGPSAAPPCSSMFTPVAEFPLLTPRGVVRRLLGDHPTPHHHGGGIPMAMEGLRVERARAGGGDSLFEMIYRGSIDTLAASASATDGRTATDSSPVQSTGRQKQRRRRKTSPSLKSTTHTTTTTTTSGCEEENSSRDHRGQYSDSLAHIRMGGVPVPALTSSTVTTITTRGKEQEEIEEEECGSRHESDADVTCLTPSDSDEYDDVEDDDADAGGGDGGGGAPLHTGEKMQEQSPSEGKTSPRQDEGSQHKSQKGRGTRRRATPAAQGNVVAGKGRSSERRSSNPGSSSVGSLKRMLHRMSAIQMKERRFTSGSLAHRIGIATAKAMDTDSESDDDSDGNSYSSDNDSEYNEVVDVHVEDGCVVYGTSLSWGCYSNDSSGLMLLFLAVGCSDGGVRLFRGSYNTDSVLNTSYTRNQRANNIDFVSFLSQCVEDLSGYATGSTSIPTFSASRANRDYEHDTAVRRTNLYTRTLHGYVFGLQEQTAWEEVGRAVGARVCDSDVVNEQQQQQQQQHDRSNDNHDTDRGRRHDDKGTDGRNVFQRFEKILDDVPSVSSTETLTSGTGHLESEFNQAAVDAVATRMENVLPNRRKGRGRRVFVDESDHVDTSNEYQQVVREGDDQHDGLIYNSCTSNKGHQSSPSSPSSFSTDYHRHYLQLMKVRGLILNRVCLSGTPPTVRLTAGAAVAADYSPNPGTPDTPTAVATVNATAGTASAGNNSPLLPSPSSPYPVPPSAAPLDSLSAAPYLFVLKQKRKTQWSSRHLSVVVRRRRCTQSESTVKGAVPLETSRRRRVVRMRFFNSAGKKTKNGTNKRNTNTLRNKQRNFTRTRLVNTTATAAMVGANAHPAAMSEKLSAKSLATVGQSSAMVDFHKNNDGSTISSALSPQHQTDQQTHQPGQQQRDASSHQHTQVLGRITSMTIILSGRTGNKSNGTEASPPEPTDEIELSHHHYMHTDHPAERTDETKRGRTDEEEVTVSVLATRELQFNSSGSGNPGSSGHPISSSNTMMMMMLMQQQQKPPVQEQTHLTHTAPQQQQQRQQDHKQQLLQRLYDSHDHRVTFNEMIDEGQKHPTASSPSAAGHHPAGAASEHGRSHHTVGGNNTVGVLTAHRFAFHVNTAVGHGRQNNQNVDAADGDDVATPTASALELPSRFNDCVRFTQKSIKSTLVPISRLEAETNGGGGGRHVTFVSRSGPLLCVRPTQPLSKQRQSTGGMFSVLGYDMEQSQCSRRWSVSFARTSESQIIYQEPMAMPTAWLSRPLGGYHEPQQNCLSLTHHHNFCHTTHRHDTHTKEYRHVHTVEHAKVVTGSGSDTGVVVNDRIPCTTATVTSQTTETTKIGTIATTVCHEEDEKRRLTRHTTFFGVGAGGCVGIGTVNLVAAGNAKTAVSTATFTAQTVHTSWQYEAIPGAWLPTDDYRLWTPYTGAGISSDPAATTAVGQKLQLLFSWGTVAAAVRVNKQRHENSDPAPQKRSRKYNSGKERRDGDHDADPATTTIANGLRDGVWVTVRPTLTETEPTLDGQHHVPRVHQTVFLMSPRAALMLSALGTANDAEGTLLNDVTFDNESTKKKKEKERSSVSERKKKKVAVSPNRRARSSRSTPNPASQMQVGTRVWVHSYNSPWWPARIASIENERGGGGLPEGCNARVIFYGECQGKRKKENPSGNFQVGEGQNVTYPIDTADSDTVHPYSGGGASIWSNNRQQAFELSFRKAGYTNSELAAAIREADADHAVEEEHSSTSKRSREAEDENDEKVEDEATKENEAGGSEDTQMLSQGTDNSVNCTPAAVPPAAAANELSATIRASDQEENDSAAVEGLAEEVTAEELTEIIESTLDFQDDAAEKKDDGTAAPVVKYADEVNTKKRHLQPSVASRLAIALYNGADDVATKLRRTVRRLRRAELRGSVTPPVSSRQEDNDMLSLLAEIFSDAHHKRRLSKTSAQRHQLVQLGRALLTTPHAVVTIGAAVSPVPVVSSVERSRGTPLTPLVHAHTCGWTRDCVALYVLPPPPTPSADAPHSTGSKVEATVRGGGDDFLSGEESREEKKGSNCQSATQNQPQSSAVFVTPPYAVVSLPTVLSDALESMKTSTKDDGNDEEANKTNSMNGYDAHFNTAVPISKLAPCPDDVSAPESTHSGGNGFGNSGVSGYRVGAANDFSPSLKSHHISNVEWSPDGRRLYVAFYSTFHNDSVETHASSSGGHDGAPPPPSETAYVSQTHHHTLRESWRSYRHEQVNTKQVTRPSTSDDTNHPPVEEHGTDTGKDTVNGPGMDRRMLHHHQSRRRREHEKERNHGQEGQQYQPHPFGLLIIDVVASSSADHHTKQQQPKSVVSAGGLSLYGSVGGGLLRRVVCLPSLYSFDVDASSASRTELRAEADVATTCLPSSPEPTSTPSFANDHFTRSSTSLLHDLVQFGGRSPPSRLLSENETCQSEHRGLVNFMVAVMKHVSARQQKNEEELRRKRRQLRVQQQQQQQQQRQPEMKTVPKDTQHRNDNKSVNIVAPEKSTAPAPATPQPQQVVVVRKKEKKSSTTTGK